MRATFFQSLRRSGLLQRFLLHHYLAQPRSYRDHGYTLDAFVADAPIRAKVRNIQAHGAYYGCDMCCARATNSKEFSSLQTSRVKVIQNGSTRVWPRETMQGTLRTNEQMMQVINKDFLICFEHAFEEAMLSDC